MRFYYVTTTAPQAETVMKEILRVDGEATISHRRENKTLLLVHSARLTEWSLESISGVAHAVALSSIRNARS